jgi:hypothetical protein
MIKKIFTIIFVCFIQTISSQETIFEFENDLKTSSSDIKDVIPIVNEETGEIVFFIADAKNVYAYKLNKNFEVIDKLISEKKERKFKQFVGHSISKNGDYNLYLQNKNSDVSFLEVNFSFGTKHIKSKEFSLSYVKKSSPFFENYVKSISYKNKFYIISSLSDNKGFAIYTFNENNEFKGNFIGEDLTEFLSKKNKESSAGKLMHKFKNQITLIDKDIPNSIEMVAEPVKIYTEKNAFIFSFDNNPLYTQLLNVNLNDFSCSYTKFDKPMQKVKEKKKNTNSFLFKDKIALLTSISAGLQLNILDKKQKTLLAEYKIYQTDSITFKNTPIIQEGGMYSGYREMESSKKFLRKINSGKVGVSFRKMVDGNYHMILGGYKEQRAAPMPMMGGFGGIPIGGIGGLTMAINPTMFAFNSYSNSKSTRIESLLDKNLSHIKGEIKENAFDKMKEIESSGKGSTVFKYNNFYIQTKYDVYTKKFSFRKFTD